MKKEKKYFKKNKKIIVLSFLSAVLVNILLNFNYVDFKFNVGLLSPNKIMLFIYSTIFILAIVSLLTALSNNVLLSVSTTLIFGAVFGVINSLKLKVRGEPFYSQDFAFITVLSDLIEMLDPRDVVLIVIVVFLVIVLLTIVFIQSKRKKINLFDDSKKSIMVRVLVSAMAVSFLLHGRNISISASYSLKIAKKIGFEKDGLEFRDVYAENGFILGFFSSFKGEIMEVPENYSKVTMENLVSEYQKKADIINENRLYDNFEDVNIIYILSESMSNPNNIENLKLNINPLKYIEDTSDKAYTGKVVVPTYGGGTTNAEFEVLTSLSIQELNSNMSLPFQDFLSKYDFFPSIVSEFSEGENNKAISFHSFTDEMYKRREVYKILQFDHSFFRDDMTDPSGAESSMYISDKSLYDEVYKLLENSEESLFVNAVTMQNHYPYNNYYSDNEYKVTEGRGDKMNNSQIETFSKGISISDMETKKLIDKISKIDKKTIVVFYGDHLPGIYNDYFESNNLISLSETPYFVYSNFSEATLDQKGLTSLTVMNNLVKDLASVKISPFDAMILEYREELLTGRFDQYVGSSGTQLSRDDFDEKESKAYEDFTLFQYDILSGKKYSLK